LRENGKKKVISMEELKPMLKLYMQHKRNLGVNMGRSQIGNENIIKTLITKVKIRGVVIFVIVIFIQYPLNIIIGIKLQPIPTSLRLTFPLSTEKTMLKNI